MKAIFNGETHELPEGRVNVVFNRSHGDSLYPDAVNITPEACMDYYAGMGEPSDATEALFLAIVDDFDEPVTREALDRSQPCYRRLAAMLEWSVRLTIERKKFVWKYPENGLHPRHQGNIADVAIAFTNPAAMRSLMARYLHKANQQKRTEE